MSLIEDESLEEYMQNLGIEYIPELYRRKLMSLVEKEEWLDVLRMGISEIAEIVAYRKLVSLRLCHQENLMVLHDLMFFIGLQNVIPHPVGGCSTGFGRYRSRKVLQWGEL